jgi:hypothetical protein
VNKWVVLGEVGDSAFLLEWEGGGAVLRGRSMVIVRERKLCGEGSNCRYYLAKVVILIIARGEDRIWERNERYSGRKEDNSGHTRPRRKRGIKSVWEHNTE